MLYYLTALLETALAPALIAGLAWSARPAPALRSLAWDLLPSFALGLLVGRLLPAMSAAQAWAHASQLAVLLAVLLLQFSRAPWSGHAATALLAALAAFRLGQDPNLNALSATSLVNTDFLLNLSALLLGAAFVIALSALLSRLVRDTPRLRWPLLLFLAALPSLPLAGHLLLALMKADVLALTRERLSLVAYATNYPRLLTHAALAAVALATLPSLRRLLRRPSDAADAIARRKALALRRSLRRLVAAAVVLAGTLSAAQFYWDEVVSRPLQRGDATRIELADDGHLHLPLDLLQDDRLHRFEWINDDGRIVRFFVINRYQGASSRGVSPGVVFDACALCGDQGYAKPADRVVCIACGVNLDPLTVGKPGGCNPIPIEGWTIAAGEILIPKAPLADNARLFSDTVENEKVTDPVSGRQFSRGEAAHTFRHETRTYFFQTDRTYETFRASPEKYLGGKACCGA